ncbi:sugar ABC transporter substrate-binding protein [Acidisphaera sp. L21]|jgi:multiple sugar transport system substrate-binding protein|uniref:ABC transporter substrate-binding protein n=1 Tax=Acidisphaera sp. L21 TaxID=1641851 RepID=UPI00131B10F8|nr:sugar ABC transporter substrate-binding protein [Acidisphaera sp. L21]
MVTRRTLLQGSAAILAAPALISRANAQSKFDWQQCKGQTVVVTMSKNPRADTLQKYQKEFEALTGIKVDSEQMPEQQQRSKAILELSTGRPSFDVLHYSLHVSKRIIGQGKWLEDLRPYVANAALTAPDFDFTDFSPSSRTTATQPDGRMDSLPLESDFWLIYVNKKLFADKGIKMPTTFDEMLTAARALTDKSSQTYGFVGRGLRNANVPVWTNFLLGQNQETITPDAHTLLTDTPQAIAAAEMYKSIMRDSAPPGVVGFNWNECQTSFMQGKVAMWMDGVGFTPPLVDKTKSKIADQVGFVTMPAGPTGHGCSVFTDAVGVTSQSKVKNAAYLYCQWATGKQMLLNMVRAGGGASPRLSTYQDQGLMANSPFGQEWLGTLLASAKIARSGLPEIIPVNEFRDTFGVALTNMIGGADAATELKKATENFKPILEKSLQG